jgi:hypothetical protein
MTEIQDRVFAELGLNRSIAGDGVVSYHRLLDQATPKNPILALIHGYPQSAYEYAMTNASNKHKYSPAADGVFSFHSFLLVFRFSSLISLDTAIVPLQKKALSLT